MSDYLDKTYLLVVKRHDEDYPLIIGAMPASTWEVIGQDDWDAWKRATLEREIADDASAYEMVEAIVTIPNSTLAAMFSAREIASVPIEKAP